jgi:16S rRNA (cytosine1402-N4)-methyltransferase
MAIEAKHTPVLLNEVIEFLNPRPNQNFIDCTLGAGGHTAEILKRTAPNGKVLGIDLDGRAIEIAKKNIGSERLMAVNDSYKNLEKIVLQNNFSDISGILVDLGYSSMEITDSEKGFSFQIDAPLDMRYGNEGVTAAEIIAKSRESELEKIFRDYGEERFAKKIAHKICVRRETNPIRTTSELVEIIAEAVPKKFQHGRIHFATKIFQALRIAVNDELGNLEAVLPQAVKILNPGGRIAVISFHSLEDRIVKNFFRREAAGCICPKEFPVCNCGHKAILKILNKKPLVPSEEEAKINPRSRSAKLRVAERL